MTLHEFDETDDAVFDRLADGELSSDDYRQLLASLDDHPDGWRRCALALLEAQALRGELRAALPEQSRRGGAGQTAEVAPRRPSRVPLLTLVLSVAASFLLAFGLGMWLRGGFSAPPGGSTVAEQPTGRPRSQSDVKTPQTQPPDAPADNAGAPSPRGSITLVVDNGAGESEEVELPVYDIRSVDDAWLPDSPLSSSDIEVLRSKGFHLQQRREMVPIDLDGQRVLLPMEQVEIVPVSATYQ